MKTEQQLQLQAYLDNELSPAEARKVANLITSDAEAQALYRELKDTKELVMANEMPLKLQEPHDFYWSQIQRRIVAEEKTLSRTPQRGWFVRFVAPLAGACALIALVFTLVSVNQNKDVPIARNDQVITPAAPVRTEAFPSTLRQVEGSEMSTITFRSESEGMTVVWISNDI